MTTLSRRKVVRSAVALPAAFALTAVASTSADPIFAKIATVRATWAAYGAVASRVPTTADGALASETEKYARWQEAKDEASDK